MKKQSVEQILKFTGEFLMESHALTSAKVQFDEFLNKLTFGEYDMYGDTTNFQVIDPEGHEVILDIPINEEMDIIIELSEIFESVGYDKATFIETIQEKYKEQNQI